MNEYEEQLINAFYLGEIDQEQFNEEFGVPPENRVSVCRSHILRATQSEDGDSLEDALTLVFIFEIEEHFTDVMNVLLEADWHYRHEDIAKSLQFIASETSIEPLYRTAFRKFQYLEADDSHALARKCTWGLADIGTPEAIEKLRLIVEKSDDDVVRGYAQKRLDSL